MDRETADEIKRNFDVVAEGLRSEIGRSRTELSAELTGFRAELGTEIASLRAEIHDVRADLSAELTGFRAELGTEIVSLRAEIHDVRADLSAELTGFRAELGTEIVGLRAEISDVKRHSDVVAESLRSEIRLVAEGVAGLDEKFTQEFLRFREDVGEQFGEMKSLLRGSYGDLDRRVQALERKPS